MATILNKRAALTRAELQDKVPSAVLPTSSLTFDSDPRAAHVARIQRRFLRGNELGIRTLLKTFLFG